MVSGWDATTALKRSDYGLAWNKVIEGTQVVGDDVKIELHIEADKK
jgi:polyisoprenoid-binding protein YceI